MMLYNYQGAQQDVLYRQKPLTTRKGADWESTENCQDETSRSHSLHRRRSTERDRFRTGDVESTIDFSSSNARAYMPRKESATHEKLKQDIARLKAETESRPMKKDGTFTPKSQSREPSVQESLKKTSQNSKQKL